MKSFLDRIEEIKKQENKKNHSFNQLCGNSLAKVIFEELSFGKKISSDNQVINQHINTRIGYIKKYIEMGANLNLPFDYGEICETLLSISIKFENYALVELLLNNGADMQQMFWFGNKKYTPISYIEEQFKHSPEKIANFVNSTCFVIRKKNTMLSFRLILVLMI